MSIKKMLIIVNILIIGCLTFSCSDKSLEEELDDWCACEHEAATNLQMLDSCNQLLIDITQKYEFDPESVPVIREKVKNCE